MLLNLKLSSAVTQMLTHVVVVFIVAFAGQMVTSLTGVVSISALLAVLTSAAAAGVTAVLHYVMGLVPSPPAVTPKGRAMGTAVALITVSRLRQFGISIVATFLTIFGASLVAGATHVTSLPSLTDFIMAAISAGVAGVIQYVIGLIPAPKPAPTPPAPTPAGT